MAVNSSFVGEAEIIYKAIWREKNMNGKEHHKNNGNSIYCSGSVGMGSMISWEPINFRTVGSGTHQFWKETTKMYPNFTRK